MGIFVLKLLCRMANTVSPKILLNSSLHVLWPEISKSHCCEFLWLGGPKKFSLLLVTCIATVQSRLTKLQQGRPH